MGATCLVGPAVAASLSLSVNSFPFAFWSCHLAENRDPPHHLGLLNAPSSSSLLYSPAKPSLSLVLLLHHSPFPFNIPLSLCFPKNQRAWSPTSYLPSSYLFAFSHLQVWNNSLCNKFKLRVCRYYYC